MEPPCALAHVTKAGCEVWAPNQNPQAARDTVAGTLGLDKKKVKVHTTLLGGGFGRKSKPDFIAEAAIVSREIGAPVRAPARELAPRSHLYTSFRNGFSTQ